MFYSCKFLSQVTFESDFQKKLSGVSLPLHHLEFSVYTHTFQIFLDWR